MAEVCRCHPMAAPALFASEVDSACPLAVPPAVLVTDVVDNETAVRAVADMRSHVARTETLEVRRADCSVADIVVVASSAAVTVVARFEVDV